jgi:hypothetical protein
MSDVKRAIDALRRAANENSAELAEILGGRRATELARVLREPTVMELASAFCNAGWVTSEVEFLAREVRPDEAIKSWDAWSVTTRERVIDRAELRSKNRPRSWTRIDTWEASFPSIPERST